MNGRVLLCKWLLYCPQIALSLLILVTVMLASEVTSVQGLSLPRLEVMAVTLPLTISLTSATKPVFDYENSNRVFKHISYASNQRQRHHEHHWGPFFENTRNVSASGAVTAVHLFTKAVLNCRVGMLRDKVVMWVRRTADKVSLLTVGNVTHSSDPRLNVKFQYPNNWQLVINPVYWKDAGIYMCQVSTHPPRIFTTNLTVIEPPVRLVDDHGREVGERYFRAGSTIDLQCQISLKYLNKEHLIVFKNNLNTTNHLLPSNGHRRSVQFQIQSDRISLGQQKGIQQPMNVLFNSKTFEENLIEDKASALQLQNRLSKLVYWAKDDKSLSTDVHKRVSFSENWFTIRISIADAKFSDGGNYSCSLSNLFTAIVQVHVLKGELPAAVQDNSSRMLFFQSSRSWSVMRDDHQRWYCWLVLLGIIPAFLPSNLY